LIPMWMTRISRKRAIAYAVVLFTVAFVAYAVAILPPEPTLATSAQTSVESKDTYVRITLFKPTGDEYTRIPFCETVHVVNTASGVQVEVDAGIYESLQVGHPVTVQYWARGWLDWKTLLAG